MRKAFSDEIYSAHQRDENVKLVTGDLGFGLFNDFLDNKDFLINAGIAEASLVGLCSGLALAGKKPFAYSIAPFLTLRAFEQIKLDIAFPNLPVCIVGVGAGVDYNHAGETHYSLEDLALMLQLPNFEIFSPATRNELKECLDLILTSNNPSYLRLANRKCCEDFVRAPNIVKSEFKYFQNSGKSLVISSGPRSNELLENILEQNLNVDLLHVLNFNLNQLEIISIINNYGKVAIVEDQFNTSGLSMLIPQLALSDNLKCRLRSFSFDKKYIHKFGDYEYLCSEYGSSNLDALNWLAFSRS